MILKEKLLKPAFSLFPTMFFPYPKHVSDFWLQLLPANAFNSELSTEFRITSG